MLRLLAAGSITKEWIVIYPKWVAHTRLGRILETGFYTDTGQDACLWWQLWLGQPMFISTMLLKTKLYPGWATGGPVDRYAAVQDRVCLHLKEDTHRCPKNAASLAAYVRDLCL